MNEFRAKKLKKFESRGSNFFSLLQNFGLIFFLCQPCLQINRTRTEIEVLRQIFSGFFRSSYGTGLGCAGVGSEKRSSSGPRPYDLGRDQNLGLPKNEPRTTTSCIATLVAVQRILYEKYMPTAIRVYEIPSF